MDDIINVKNGDVICEEGEYELWMYEVVSGTADVYKNYGQEDQAKVGEIDSGYVGEMGVISGMPRIATVVATSDMSLIRLEENDLVDYFKEHPDKIKDILFCLSNRLHSIDEYYTEACTTINECLRAEKEDLPKSNKLVAAINKCVDIYQKILL